LFSAEPISSSKPVPGKDPGVVRDCGLIDKMKEIVSVGSQVFRLQTDKSQIRDSGDDLAEYGSMFFVAEMKGGKHHTKAHDTQVANCLRRCFSNFEQQFSGLDWDHMHRPENGTLLVDLGVTHHPVHPTPLVGLWRLNSLKASFSAAGFNTGTIHHLNMLCLYGGLQAEMSKEHRDRSHVVFQLSYNLAYKVTRPLDNNRELFTDKGAYDIDPEYLHYAEEVSNIYTNEASHKAFGVRDEVCMGGEAFLCILDDLDAQVVFIVLVTIQFADKTPAAGRRDYEFQSHTLDSITYLVPCPGKKDSGNLSCAVLTPCHQALQLQHSDWDLDLSSPVCSVYATHDQSSRQ
jgi:hypothetical protein